MKISPHSSLNLFKNVIIEIVPADFRKKDFIRSMNQGTLASGFVNMSVYFNIPVNNF